MFRWTEVANQRRLKAGLGVFFIAVVLAREILEPGPVVALVVAVAVAGELPRQRGRQLDLYLRFRPNSDAPKPVAHFVFVHRGHPHFLL
jgi:hypothetical protein